MSTLLLLGLVVLVGSLVQSSIGFGIAVVAAPFVVLVAPELMPTALLVLGFTLPLTQLVAGPRDIDWALLRSALGARVLLTPVGVWLVTVLPARGIALVVGVMVLVSVALSIRRVDAVATQRNALAAGALTGISGTAAAIGGPFFAIVLQNERPDRIRATLAAFFVAGSTVSMVALAIGGQMHVEQLRAALVWLPFLFAGYLLSGPVKRRLDHARMRRSVLAFCAISSVVVILRALVL